MINKITQTEPQCSDKVNIKRILDLLESSVLLMVEAKSLWYLPRISFFSYVSMNRRDRILDSVSDIQKKVWKLIPLTQAMNDLVNLCLKIIPEKGLDFLISDDLNYNNWLDDVSFRTIRIIRRINNTYTLIRLIKRLNISDEQSKSKDFWINSSEDYSGLQSLKRMDSKSETLVFKENEKGNTRKDRFLFRIVEVLLGISMSAYGVIYIVERSTTQIDLNILAISWIIFGILLVVGGITGRIRKLKR